MMMARITHRFYGILLLSLLSILSASCSSGPSVPFPATDFTLEDVFTGEEIHLAALKGRPVLLYFFASW
jgi:cytochrome oxidase Cu insertion factor (SCO1/SenC/PrrC family)